MILILHSLKPNITLSLSACGLPKMPSTQVNAIIGCSIALTSSCLTSLAVNLQASALKEERILNNISEHSNLILNRDDSDLAPYTEDLNTLSIWKLMIYAFSADCEYLSSVQHARKLLWFKSQWYFGFILYLFCQGFGSIFALAFISPVLLAPLGSSGLIFNIIFSYVFSGTHITKYDWIGTVLIVVGCAVISTFGSFIPDPS